LINDLWQQQRQNPFQQMKQDFARLASALQSGDLSTAQLAYANIQGSMQAQRGGSTASTSTGSSPTNPILNDFGALGQAPESGDIRRSVHTAYRSNKR
jgi:hypothetical protein